MNLIDFVVDILSTVAVAVIILIIIAAIAVVWRLVLGEWWPWRYPSFLSRRQEPTKHLVVTGGRTKRKKRTKSSQSQAEQGDNEEWIAGLEQRVIQTVKDAVSGQQGEIRKSLKQIESSLGAVIKRLDQIESIKWSVQDRIQSGPVEDVRAPHEASAKNRDDRLPSSTESALKEFCQLYNASVSDRHERDRFQQRYQPTRITVANAVQRKKNPEILPEFEEHSAGDFLAVKFGDGGKSKFAVVPRFDLTFDERTVGIGTIELLFKCNNYQASQASGRVKLIKPAIFSYDGRNWKQEEEGILNLGR
ncbi:MAG: hypothetical protein L0229_24625 [Blastocatellia bacterium]|nr:hypothetical protein [Blastocatellia bacterium]